MQAAEEEKIKNLWFLMKDIINILKNNIIIDEILYKIIDEILYDYIPNNKENTFTILGISLVLIKKISSNILPEKLKIIIILIAFLDRIKIIAKKLFILQLVMEQFDITRIENIENLAFNRATYDINQILDIYDKVVFVKSIKESEIIERPLIEPNNIDNILFIGDETEAVINPNEIYLICDGSHHPFKLNTILKYAEIQMKNTSNIKPYICSICRCMLKPQKYKC